MPAPPPKLTLTKKIFTGYLELDETELSSSTNNDYLPISESSFTTDHPTLNYADITLRLLDSAYSSNLGVILTLPDQYELMNVSGHPMANNNENNIGFYNGNVVHQSIIYSKGADINTLGSIRVYFNYTFNDRI